MKINKLSVIALATSLVLAACNTNTAAPKATQDLASFRLVIGVGSGLGTQGVPFDGSGNPVLSDLDVAVFNSSNDLVTFDSNLMYDPTGSIDTIEFALGDSVEVGLPAGETYDFKVKGSDTNNVWMSYGEERKS